MYDGQKRIALVYSMQCLTLVKIWPSVFQYKEHEKELIEFYLKLVIVNKTIFSLVCISIQIYFSEMLFLEFSRDTSILVKQM